MVKAMVLGVVLVFLASGIAGAPEVDYWIVMARITACNYTTKVNQFGQRLPKNKKIVAVEPNTLPNGTEVSISKRKGIYTVFDNVPIRSVEKHYRVAERRGVDIDIVIDVYYDVPRKQLKKKDLGYQEIKIYRKE